MCLHDPFSWLAVLSNVTAGTWISAGKFVENKKKTYKAIPSWGRELLICVYIAVSKVDILSYIRNDWLVWEPDICNGPKQGTIS